MRLLCIPNVVVAIACAIASNAMAATIVTYSFTGNAGNETSSNPDSGSIASGITVGSITRGSGISASSNAAADKFGAQSFADNALDISNNEYFEFTIGVLPGYTLDLDAVKYDGTRSGSGPIGSAVRTSLEGFSTSLGSGSVVSNQIATLPNTSTYNSIAAGTNVVIRIYYFDANSTSHYGHIDNIKIEGTIIPEPASVGMLAAGSLLLLSRRRKNT